jgi:ELWxxDGT repeat protein
VENIVGVVRQFVVDTGYVYTAFRFVIAVDGDGATVLASNAVGQILDSVEQATFDGKLYFLGENDATGIELWRTDGTQEGTELFVDLWEGSSSAQPGSFFPAGDRLYFAARSEEGVVQWVTDGTSEGTRKLDEPLPAIWSSMTVGDISTADTSDGVWMVEGDSPPRKLGEFAKRSQVVGIGSERIFVRQFEDGVEQIWGYDFASAGPGADFNGDNIVDQRDLIILAANFGRSNATRPDGDADDDGHVSFTDFLILASQFSG